MKKVVLILIMLMPFLFKCKAQDTVQYGDPYYLFNERHNYMTFDPMDAFMSTWDEYCCALITVSDGMSRYITQEPVMVYGVAITIYDPIYSIDKLPFNVFLAKITVNSTLDFIDSTQWKPDDYQAFFKYSIMGAGQLYEETVPVYELYFDTPHLISDTFYVGNRKLGPHSVNCYISYDSMTSYWTNIDLTGPYHYEKFWGGMFPIIQPNRHCDVPDRPRAIVYTTTNTVQFELPYTEGDSLTLSIARVGQPIDSGYFYNVTDSVMSVVLPDSGHYEARLRRYCDRYGSFIESSWSAAFPIYLSTPLGITGHADSIALTINPNPAAGKVEVACSIADGTITLLDMQGRTLAEMPSSQRTIDISGLAAGTYILRLTAPDQAPTVHKLIVAQP
jgi:hypothetical protein